MQNNKTSFVYRNGLTLVLITMMLLFWVAQFITGWKDHNEELTSHSRRALSACEYLSSGHFVSATFENWESEFLQMAIYVILTVCLRQKGSAESKKLKDEPGANDEEVDREPVASPDAPWPVRTGGVWLTMYKNSLSITFIVLFILSFWLHFTGSFKDYNLEQDLKGQAQVSASKYLTNMHFWFESFQNWQSEFLAVASIVWLSIWLRQKGSPESKPVDAPNSETGK